MNAIKVLSLIFLCATTFRITTAQTVENTMVANPPRRDGVITIHIVNDKGRPIAGAPIFVLKAGDHSTIGSQFGIADDAGEFKATQLFPGSYTISTFVPGYVVAMSDSEREHHRPGENVTITLVKGGAITGRVTGANGEPMVGVVVMALKIRDLEGGQKYSNELVSSMQSIESRALQFRYFDEIDAAPDEKGDFSLKGLAEGRFLIKADLPDDGWYIRAITQSASGAAEKPVDGSRNGIALKAGEKLSGVEVVIAEGAASLNGRVVSANKGAQLASRLRVHLIPAEISAADDVLRYAETMVQAGGGFEFKHIAPGKYLLYARRAAEPEDQARPLALDKVERAKLRREAADAKNEFELKVCEHLKDFLLRWE